MEFPRLVYKTPGPNPIKGGSYAFIAVADNEGLKAALREGWFSTLPEAVECAYVDNDVIPDDEAIPTRQEMELKARELGIKFDGRTGDKALLKRITDAIGS